MMNTFMLLYLVVLYFKCMYINKKIFYCRDLVTLTSHDPKTPTLGKKIFNIFVPHIKGLSACQKSKWDLYGFFKYLHFIEQVCLMMQIC